MLQRGPVFVGDLKPIGEARPLTVVRPGASVSSLVTTSIYCVSSLTLFAAGAAWIVPHKSWISTPSTRRAAAVASTELPPPATFPPWIEVPHLSGSFSHADDPDTFATAEGPRTFLDPNPAEASEQPTFLPPRANPRLPLISRSPLDAAYLTHEQPPSWNKRQSDVTSIPPSVVATQEPNVPQPSQDRAEAGTTRSLSADPTITPLLPPGSVQVQAPSAVLVQPALTITAASPPGQVATLSPDPALQGVDRTNPVRTLPDAGAVGSPILNPGPARHARSLRQPRKAPAISRARVPYRDADHTASIISLPKSIRARIDAGAVAHASMHRGRADRSDHPVAQSRSPAPSSPWTLPPALAPTD